MLQALSVEEARRVAALAKAARDARDAFLGNVPKDVVGEPPPAHGERTPTAAFGFSPLEPDAPPLRELHEAVQALTPTARAELFAVVRIGQSDLAVGNWAGMLAEADLLGDATIAAALVENADLHNHLIKGLYELKLSP